MDETSVRGRIDCRLKTLVSKIGHSARDTEFISMLIICLNYSKDEKDGLLYMWQGYHGDVEVVKFPALFGIPIRKVAIGTDHSVFLALDGRLFSCGSNVHGQLGVITGDKDQAYDPVQVSGLSGKSRCSYLVRKSHQFLI